MDNITVISALFAHVYALFTCVVGASWILASAPAKLSLCVCSSDSVFMYDYANQYSDHENYSGCCVSRDALLNRELQDRWLNALTPRWPISGRPRTFLPHDHSSVEP